MVDLIQQLMIIVGTGINTLGQLVLFERRFTPGFALKALLSIIIII